ncbi:formimidoylglutamate deiminase [Sphingomonas laterariae]|uniref:Formimidoylglutamate deiminase n=1 Tax=Edaphosphingomonas laterariae TaxID=861865 RepID=A0A239BJX3_9SPHN|nr:formimidoylglutamate deiminase [Sphingomonas laterariae]SNS07681.1 formimidoylglutamate deiminase [Sphingomonas laterariae]
MVEPSTFHFASVRLADGWARNVRISVAAGRISTIEQAVSADASDVRIAIGIPAMGNLHSHAFQRAMAGLTGLRGAGDDSFWTWRDLMYRFVGQLTPDDLEALAALAYVEMVEAGYARVGEFHYLHHDLDGRGYANPAEMAERVAAAANVAGIGLTMLPVFYAQGGFGGQPAGEGQRRFLSSVDGYARLIEASRAALAGIDGAVVGIAPHSLRAVTPEQLDAILPLAAANPIHIHIAEQTREVEDCLAWSGSRPVQWLLDNAPVDPNWCLVHATHLDDAEVGRLASSGAVAGLCPITEADLGDGLFPAVTFRGLGGAWGIGTDSNVAIDMADELRLLEYGQRLHHRGRNVLAGEGEVVGDRIFADALHGGARALGAAMGLAVGMPADWVSLDGDHPALCGRSDASLLDSFIFAAGRSAIDGVWRGGRQMVAGGRHKARAAVVARYHVVLQRLLAS